MENVLPAPWAMLYASDAYIATRTTQNLTRMMAMAVDLCRAIGLTLSEQMTETMCMPVPHPNVSMVSITAADQKNIQMTSLVYLKGAVTECPDFAIEINRRAIFAWRLSVTALVDTTDQTPTSS